MSILDVSFIHVFIYCLYFKISLHTQSAEFGLQETMLLLFFLLIRLQLLMYEQVTVSLRDTNANI